MMFSIESGGDADANCVSLYHFDSNLTDAMGKVPLSVDGTSFAGYSTSSKKFGTAAFLGRQTSSYGTLYNDDSTAWKNAFANEYTVDFWVRRVSRTGYYDLYLCYNYDMVPWLAIRVMANELRVNSTPNSFNQAVTFTFSTSTWNHIAIVKKGTNLLAFIDGVLKATWSFPYTIGSTHTRGSEISRFETGYGLNSLDELRISNVARWTKNFTPPTAAYASIDVGGNESNDPNCITLLHFDNNTTNSSSIPQTWTKGQYVLYSSSIKKFGTHAMYDQYGVDPFERDPNPFGDFVNNSGVFYQYLSGDWTAECWFMTPNGTDGYMSFPFALHRSSNLYSYFDIGISDTTIRLSNSTSGTSNTFDQGYSVSTSIDTWHHLAVVKKDNLINVYIDGVAKVTNVPWAYVPNSGWTNSAIGSYNYGYIDEFRFSNIARWTTNFTPPTEAYV